jgi:hypothetical protein
VKPLHRLARFVLGRIDAWYYRRHDLRTVGPVLYLGRAQYRGPQIRFDDGTLLEDCDPIGRLHFNNASIAALGEGSMQRVGFRFAKLMRESMRRLCEVAQSDPAWRDIEVFQGLTWLPAHGEVVGFVTTPMPQGWKKRWVAGHFRLLSWAFAPAASIRSREHTEPRHYWLTRTALTGSLHKLKTSGTTISGSERCEATLQHSGSI